MSKKYNFLRNANMMTRFPDHLAGTRIEMKKVKLFFMNYIYSPTKELSLCHKLKFTNPYVSATYFKL